MTEKNIEKISVNRLTVTRIALENRPIGLDETREFGFTVEAEEKSVGLENIPLVVKIRYDDL